MKSVLERSSIPHSDFFLLHCSFCGFIMRSFGMELTYGDDGFNCWAERDLRTTEDAHGQSSRRLPQGNGGNANREGVGTHAGWRHCGRLRRANASEPGGAGACAGGAVDYRTAV